MQQRFLFHCIMSDKGLLKLTFVIGFGVRKLSKLPLLIRGWRIREARSWRKVSNFHIIAESSNENFVTDFICSLSSCEFLRDTKHDPFEIGYKTVEKNRWNLRFNDEPLDVTLPTHFIIPTIRIQGSCKYLIIRSCRAEYNHCEVVKLRSREAGILRYICFVW